MKTPYKDIRKRIITLLQRYERFNYYSKRESIIEAGEHLVFVKQNYLDEYIFN